MKRLLCPVETLYVGQRSRAVISSSVRGAVDARLLGAAFADLTARHPMLRGRIVHAGSGFGLEESDEPPRLRTYAADGHSHDDEVNTPLPVGGPLIRAALLQGDGTDTVVLSIDHVISDGYSAVALHNALWARYTQLAADPGAAPEPYRRHWPAPVSELLPPCPDDEVARHVEQRVEATRARPVELLPHEPAVGSEGGRIEVARLLLDVEQTAAVRRAASAADVSVHGLIAGALLATARRRLGGEGPRTLGCLTAVDLRSRLTPELPRELMVAAVSFHAENFDVAAGADPLEQARLVTGGLRRALAAGEPLAQLRLMPLVARNPQLMVSTVIATNMGAVQGPPLPEGLELLDLRLVPAREDYYPQAGRGPVLACVTTFNGRLAVEFPHWTGCFGAAAMAAFRDGVRDALSGLATAGAPVASLAP